ncbi:MAG: murein biosynthesis integral membrane protein MurJ [Clostridiaceae bacterium]|nr:murein biosynthesis integral membrane protein MurJ [Clostridiaceae bacterium]
MSSMILSRITGFLRSTLIPNMLSRTESDALFAAFKTTDLMYNLLVGGSIAAALIPVLSGYLARGREEEGWKVVGSFINVIFIAMVIISGLGIIFAPQVVSLTAPGYNPETTSLTIALTRILFPSVIFIMLAGLTNGVLNSYQRFAAAAYGPSIYNLGSVLSILIFHDTGVEKVAFGIMTSAFIYFLFQLSFAHRNMKYYRLKIHFKHPGFKRIVKLAIPSLLASSIVQINTVISQSYTSNFEKGSVTALTNANDIWQLPYGIFAMGMGTAILPTLSEKLAVGEKEAFKKIFDKSVKSMLILVIPSAVGFIVLREPVISAIYKWSVNFGADRINMTGSILMFFSLALLSQSILAIVNRAFYACNDTKTPLYSGAVSIVSNALLCYIFFNYTSIGASGMAMAYSISSMVNLAILMYALGRKIKGIYSDQWLKFIIKTVVASAIMGIMVFLFKGLIPVDFSRPFSIDSKMAELLYLFLMIAFGVMAYFVIMVLMGIKEVTYLLGIIKNKFRITSDKV